MTAKELNRAAISGWLRWRKSSFGIERRRSPLRWFYIGGRNILTLHLPWGLQIWFYLGR